VQVSSSLATKKNLSFRAEIRRQLSINQENTADIPTRLSEQPKSEPFSTNPAFKILQMEEVEFSLFLEKRNITREGYNDLKNFKLWKNTDSVDVAAKKWVLRLIKISQGDC
jgi:hypothetical protein